MKKLTPEDPASHSADVVAENVEHLRAFFPEAFTEGKVDFEVLKQLLGGVVDERQEKYGLNWHGKRRARQLALTPSTGTLRPCPEESVDWDTTQNLMIEGDNLEVLKLLQKSYSGKVKMIYIDPPYNTGKDFVYLDRYEDNLDTYLCYTGQRSSEGQKLSTNTEGSGRFHTRWLNMMYPRLKLARNLLREDGTIFISIDDHEIASLRQLCVELFGEENFIAQFVWNTEGHTDNQFDVKVNHEYVLLIAKNFQRTRLGHVVDPNTREESNLWKGYAENSITKNGPGNPPSTVMLPAGFPCQVDSLFAPASETSEAFFEAVKERGYVTRELTSQFSASYPIRLDSMTVKAGRLVSPCRVFSGWANVNKLRRFIQNRCLPIDDNGDQLSFHLSDKGVIYYRRDRTKARHILSVLREMGTTERMRSELEQLGIPFRYPKPKELLRYLVQVGAEEGGLVLDFFAGSGSLGHALMEQNAVDGKVRHYVLVQLPEALDLQDKEQVLAAKFCDEIKRPHNLAEVTKERLRRTTAEIHKDNPMFCGDLGFRVFKLDRSNIRAWDPNPEDLESALFDGVEHLHEGRTEQDVLYELLLKRGLDLCVPIEERVIADKPVHSVGAGTLLVCLAKTIAADEVEALALGMAAWREEQNPASNTTVVFRDSAFANDVAKTNIAAILEQHGLENVRSL